MSGWKRRGEVTDRRFAILREKEKGARE